MAAKLRLNLLLLELTAVPLPGQAAPLYAVTQLGVLPGDSESAGIAHNNNGRVVVRSTNGRDLPPSPSRWAWPA